MNLQRAVEDEVVREARRRAQGTEQETWDPAGMRSRDNDAAEFVRLSLLANGDTGGWKFNREEAHDHG